MSIYSNFVVCVFGALFMLLFGAIGLPILRRLNARQEVREEGPQSHRKKAGTPTMGGILMILAFLTTLLLAGNWNPAYGWLLFLVLGHFALGLSDDAIKALHHRNLGLTAKQKLAGQIFLAAIFAYALTDCLGLPTSLHIPLLDTNISLGNFYYLFAMIVIVGTTNAVNLTDGLDGLAAGISALVAAAFVWLSLSARDLELAQFSAALAGVCLGFLAFNYHPAKVFMGDTGSLALGAAFAGLALVTRTELLLVIIGGVFVMEAVSVILQVASFKTTGRRLFRMSPLHHHFELGGWSEVRVVHTFWLAALLCVGVGISLTI